MKILKKPSHFIALICISIVVLVFLILLVRQSTVTYTISTPQAEQADQTFAAMRQDMVEKQLKGRDIVDERVLSVMGNIERHTFVPQHLVNHAYDDNPLPIGYGQTISQPYIVALMTQNLNIDGDDKVLEIGTGSGYQAAVLSELVQEVYTIEIIEELASSARRRLSDLGYDNVYVKHGDGYYGWEEHAPFDAIIVTAAANHIPPPLLAQLKDGGRLVIPLSSTVWFQTLTLVTKKGGEVDTEFITGVRFVPLTGKAGEG